tara:strand:+ start:2418 stop:2525 length:108 start_codon:yes stop_codon:yes gene_type:complete
MNKGNMPMFSKTGHTTLGYAPSVLESDEAAMSALL